MKRSLSCLIALLLAVASWAQKETRITLNLKGLMTGDSITLSWGTFNRPTSPLILQVGAQEGQSLRIPLNESRLIIIGLKGCAGGYELLASPNEEIVVSGRVRKDKIDKKRIVDFQKMQVEGSAWQRPYQETVAGFLLHLDSLETSVYTDFREVQRTIRRAKAEKDEAAIAEMYQTSTGRNYIGRMADNYIDMKGYYKDIILQQKENFLAPLLMLRFGGDLDRSSRSLYDALSNQAKQSYYGRIVKDAVYPPSMLGSIAPTVTVTTQDGQTQLLSFSHQSNRYLLLDFWASWCEPCLKEVPNLKRLYEKYHEKGLEIIGLSVDKNMKEWTAILEEMDEPWTNYIDSDKQAIMEYQVQYIPSIFIMDSNGKIIAEKLRGNDLSDFIDKLFAE